MTINLQDGLVYWIIPAVLALSALVLLLWWIILRVAPPPRAHSDAPRHPSPVARSEPPKKAVVTPPIDPDYHTQLDSAAKMVVLSGLSGVGDIPLPGSRVGIGRFRDDTANILVALDDKSISRKHAQIRYDVARKSYLLSDLGSTYGTFLVEKGQTRQLTVGEELLVYNKDVVQFGQTVQVRLSLPGSTREDNPETRV